LATRLMISQDLVINAITMAMNGIN
jgi:hypothetical protein